MGATKEYMQNLAKTRRSRAEIYAERYGDVHEYRLRDLHYIPEELANIIGDYDFEHDRHMIPNVDPKSDPFRRFEGSWDLDDIQDNMSLKSIKLWTPDTSIKHFRAYIFKHQNPKIGILDAHMAPAIKTPKIYLTGKGTMAENIHAYQRLRQTNHDLDKLWRIEGLYTACGKRPVKGYSGDSSIETFPATFTFGRKIIRNSYALWHKERGKFLNLGRNCVGNGSEWGWTDRPWFVYRVYKSNRSAYMKGIDMDDYYKNIEVVKFQFNPLVSLKVDLKYNTRGYNDAISDYNKGVDKMHMKNYHAFRYHIKQLEKKRKKI